MRSQKKFELEVSKKINDHFGGHGIGYNYILHPDP